MEITIVRYSAINYMITSNQSHHSLDFVTNKEINQIDYGLQFSIITSYNTSDWSIK